MSKKLRIGIVGCGSIAGNHVRGYAAAGDNQIVAVYDPLPEAARKLADATGAEVVPTEAAMVEVSALDAVSVCSPPKVHDQNCRPFLAAGIPVLCEKPLGLNAEDGKRLADEVTRTGTTFMTAFCHRFHPPIMELKKLIDEGVLGTQLLFRCIFGGHMSLEGNHRADPALSGGGPLIDHCSHSVDLFRFLVGEPTSVQAMGGNIMQDLAVEDFGMMHLDAGGKAFGEIIGSYSLPVSDNSVQYFGTEGKAQVSYGGGEPELSYLVKGMDQPETVDVAGRPDRFAAEVGHFLSCVRSGSVPRVTTEDGLRANIIVDAAYESMREGRLIHIPTPSKRRQLDKKTRREV